jgi:hypothetical protein
MFIPSEIAPNEIALFKISKISQAQFDELEAQKSLVQVSSAPSTLSVVGLSPSGDILFKYTNPSQEIDQTFGFNIKYYKGHQKDDKVNDGQFGKLNSEGIMTFLPEIDAQKPMQYSQVKDSDVIY